MKNTIAKKLRELRGGKRQKEVAAALGIKVSRYKSYEETRAEPSATMLLKIKQYYNLKSVDEIICVSI